MRSIARRLPFLLAPTVLLVANVARADKVAVLPFVSGNGATTPAQLEEARGATRAAVLRLNHAMPNDSEMLTAQMAVKDGVADTRAEYQAAGRASSSQWTVVGHVEAHGATYRLEVEACQVETGRVESLAREIDPPQAAPEVEQMLALLLRPEGIANADVPWERETKPPPAPPPAAAPPPPPPVPKGPPPPAYGEGRPFAVGASLGVIGAVHRPDRARGSSVAGVLGASFAYAPPGVRGLELRADVVAGLVGPQSISLTGGARYLVSVAPAARVFLGPEVGLGGFFPLGGDKSTRGLVRLGVAATWGVTDRVQLEAVPEVDYAGGGSGYLVLLGATLRGAYRF